MKQIMNPVLIVLIAVLAVSCEKVINVDLKNAEPRIVIEGNISTGGDTAKVTISKSVTFGSTNQFPPVRGAKVKVTDNAGNTYLFTEIAAGTYTSNSLIAEEGRTYTLSVTADGKDYTAKSTVPRLVLMDTLVQEKAPLNKAITIVTAVFTDPKGFGDYYSLLQRVNGKRTKGIFITDDSFDDGSDFPFQLEEEEDLKLKAGDIVEIELQCIDKNIYRYLVGLQDIQSGNTIPANPESNISNNALGYFSAYASDRLTIVIK